MVSTVFNYIKAYLEAALLDEVDSISIDSLSKNDDQLKEGIVMTLLNIEEEVSVMPQVPDYKNEKKYKNPDLLLNLNILFSAQDKEYSTALHNISLLLKIFQKTKVLKDEYGNEYRLSLCPVSLDQNLNIWQTLGSRMMPSVIYKVRMLTLHSDDVDDSMKIAERIGVSYGHGILPEKVDEDQSVVRRNGRDVLYEGSESSVFTAVDGKLKNIPEEKWNDHGLNKE